MGRLAIGVVVAAFLVAGCGGGTGGGSVPLPPPDSYDLQKAMRAFEASGSSTPVSLSGTANGGASSGSFTGTGTLTVSAGMTGTFNGGTALLQTATAAGTITVGGASTGYSSEVVDAYDGSTGSILGESKSGEFDVASAPIMIPSSVGTTPMLLGTLIRYTDSSLSVALGTTRISVDEMLAPIDPGTAEVVRFTFKSYDVSGDLVETDTESYWLTNDGAAYFYGTTANAASGSLSLTGTLGTP